MAYTGTQAVFPIFLPRKTQGQRDEDYNTLLAQTENEINQNYSILYGKIDELETRLSSLEEV